MSITPSETSSCGTPSTQPVSAPPTTRDTDSPRSQYQGHDADHTLAQHKTARNNYELDTAFLAAYAGVIDVLNDAADQTRDREGRRVEEPNREGDAGWDPFHVR